MIRVNWLKNSLIVLLLLLCLFHCIPATICAAPIIQSWQVGAPLGRATVLIGNNSDVRSGLYYDINYTIGFHPYFSLEFKAGLFSSPHFMTRIDDSAREDELWKAGVTFVGISPVFTIYSSEKSRFYCSVTAGYSNIEVTLPPDYATFFSKQLPDSREKIEASRIDSLALAGAVGIERKLNEILRFYCEAGYYADEFDVFVSWTDEGGKKGSAHSRELSMDSYTFGFGLKAYFKID